jgi:hypothetical protein
VNGRMKCVVSYQYLPATLSPHLARCQKSCTDWLSMAIFQRHAIGDEGFGFTAGRRVKREVHHNTAVGLDRRQHGQERAGGQLPGSTLGTTVVELLLVLLADPDRAG